MKRYVKVKNKGLVLMDESEIPDFIAKMTGSVKKKKTKAKKKEVQEKPEEVE